MIALRSAHSAEMISAHEKINDLEKAILLQSIPNSTSSEEPLPYLEDFKIKVMLLLSEHGKLKKNQIQTATSFTMSRTDTILKDLVNIGFLERQTSNGDIVYIISDIGQNYLDKIKT